MTFCFYCGGSAASGKCIRCGMEARPESPLPESLACPRCKIHLATEAIATISVRGCSRCRGCFLTRDAWNAFVLAITPSARPDMKNLVTTPPGVALEIEKLMQSVRCPACNRPMERCAFAMTSKTVIDICDSHGVWFDAGELVAVIQILAQRLEGIEPDPGAIRSPKVQAELDRIAEITDAILTAAERRQREALMRSYVNDFD